MSELDLPLRIVVFEFPDGRIYKIVGTNEDRVRRAAEHVLEWRRTFLRETYRENARAIRDRLRLKSMRARDHRKPFGS